MNWIVDINRFGIPEPPHWFLQALHDLDAMLVLLPSRQRQVYILARRREKTMRVPLMVKAHNDLLRQTRGSDGDLLASHNLNFVDVIKGHVHGTWSPAILQDLRDRDTWAAGGAEKFTDALEAKELATKQKVRKDLLDDIDQRAGDAYRSYQARTGQRNQHSNAGHKKSATVARVRLNSSSTPSSTSGSGFSVVSGFIKK